MSWSKAFRKAVKTEAKGAKDFTDVDFSRNFAVDDEVSGQGGGGFCQPDALARFVSNLDNEKDDLNKIVNISDSALSSEGGGIILDFSAEQAQVEKKDNLSKQLCRHWLKHTYLDIGAPCVDPDCKRKHSIPENINSMYSDYAFKSLNPNHKKRILAMLKGGSDEAGAKELTETTRKENNHSHNHHHKKKTRRE